MCNLRKGLTKDGNIDLEYAMDQRTSRKQGRRILMELAWALNFIAGIILLIAFVTPFWAQSWPRVYTPFKHVGLWEICFAGNVLDTDPSQKSYHGCWWILAGEFSKIKSWLIPPWFTAVQVIVTFCFVAELLIFIFDYYMWCITGALRRKNWTARRDPIWLLNLTTGLVIFKTVGMTISILLFGLFFENDRHWMPMHQFNYPSWSYGLAIVSTFFDWFASGVQIIYVSLVRRGLRSAPKNRSRLPDQRGATFDLDPHSGAKSGTTYMMPIIDDYNSTPTDMGYNYKRADTEI